MDIHRNTVDIDACPLRKQAGKYIVDRQYISTYFNVFLFISI